MVTKIIPRAPERTATCQSTHPPADKPRPTTCFVAACKATCPSRRIRYCTAAQLVGPRSAGSSAKDIGQVRRNGRPPQPRPASGDTYYFFFNWACHALPNLRTVPSHGRRLFACPIATRVSISIPSHIHPPRRSVRVDFQLVPFPIQPGQSALPCPAMPCPALSCPVLGPRSKPRGGCAMWERNGGGVPAIATAVSPSGGLWTAAQPTTCLVYWAWPSLSATR